MQVHQRRAQEWPWRQESVCFESSGKDTASREVGEMEVTGIRQWLALVGMEVCREFGSGIKWNCLKRQTFYILIGVVVKEVSLSKLIQLYS